MDSVVEIQAALERARSGTEDLLAPVSDQGLVEQVSPLQSTLVWELARIAHFEELWLLRDRYGQAPVADSHREVSEALRQERNGARTFRFFVRRRFWTTRPTSGGVSSMRSSTPSSTGPAHCSERDSSSVSFCSTSSNTKRRCCRHSSSGPMSNTRWKTGSRSARPPTAPTRYGSREARSSLARPTSRGPTTTSSSRTRSSSRRSSSIAPPVTNGAFTDFIHRGYSSRKHWSPEGWAWREREKVMAPLFWERSKGGWERVRFGRLEPVPMDEPVQHVSWYEADAFARWAGKRLPTEAEWERAAAWHERRGKDRFPWGGEWTGYEANLGHRRFSPAPAGSYAGGESRVGCRQLTGDVWEWTSSRFLPYPGFIAFPYPEFSEVFFGDEHRVLRGGSWATDSVVARSTFRSWDFPDRRQIFARFRCARDG